MLTSESIEFYTDFISDDTKILGQKWKEFKKSVMGSIYYKEEPWFNELHKYEKRILESLIFAQKELGQHDAPLGPTRDPLHVKEIEEKIEVLFPEESFYFYN